MILITGAAGKTGQAILHALSGRPEPVRAFVRRPEQAQELAQLGASEVTVGDFCDLQALQSACQGVRAVYHICPNMHPDETAIAAALLAACRAAGIERFVYHSVLHPQVEAMPHHWNKMRVEEMLFTSGLNYTILQPAAYMQNVLGYWTKITQERLYAVPYPIQTRLNMVDLEDVARVAALVLTEAGHQDAIYELCGPQALTQAEVAQALSLELGYPVQAAEIPLAQWDQQARKSGMNEYARETLLKMFDYYAKFGFTGNPKTLTCLLQKAPTNFAAFVRRIVKP